MKFIGKVGLEVLLKLRKSVKKIENGREELIFGAVEGGVDNLLAQILSETLHQVQIK